MKFCTTLFGSLLILIQIAQAAKNNVKHVTSIDQFYNICNNANGSYTMVKYYTTWCHHCKRLGPIYEELSDLYKNVEGDDNVTFLNVNCEIFGSTLCVDLPGFPIINLIKPLDKPLNIKEFDWNSLSFFERIWKRIYDKLYLKNPYWQIDPDRIVKYQGRRDVEPLDNFIKTVKAKDELSKKVSSILNPNYHCSDADLFCKEGKIYLLEFLEQLDHSKQNGDKRDAIFKERMKLENIIRNNEKSVDKDTLQVIKLKLELLNTYEDTIQDVQHDEL
ncbi:protein disulfide isomerase MPD2 NDAI_0G04340 [Naumovozyma dairenensis CBS 421]|uniref:Thioredoxin domain-containing protein n=1 Tax=Naumovozyma dairenensis (strain ATCC 10597 / BCRC 20456 / CBS 421 / NBRC 0211 / NRRL Y-12639) TaxID=1071378 RepID=J7RE96_NAUDC|nr:hypothetical protein NDAI_0G04340 [Naumovozyma dairenensis CBS 421]CCK73419.1 hypothetical protein NDAI_0G04340 [Naumovozyma dairenensis CBS 421]